MFAIDRENVWRRRENVCEGSRHVEKKYFHRQTLEIRKKRFNFANLKNSRNQISFSTLFWSAQFIYLSFKKNRIEIGESVLLGISIMWNRLEILLLLSTMFWRRKNLTSPCYITPNFIIALSSQLIPKLCSTI